MEEATQIEVLPGVVRRASISDARAVAEILAEAFPQLYQSTLGTRTDSEATEALFSLYSAGHLSLEDTHLFVRGERVLGMVILHTGKSIGRGDARSFARLLLSQFGLFRGVRALFGGLGANYFLAKRIPHAPDLIYIEGLAVREAHRGQGVGSRLLQEAERQTRLKRGGRLALHVLHRNTAARRLYERVGFKPWHDAPITNKNPQGWSAFLMVKSLD